LTGVIIQFILKKNYSREDKSSLLLITADKIFI